MARRRSLDDTLERLHQIRDDPRSETALALLRDELDRGVSHAAALSAQIAGEFELAELQSELVAAFDRFMQKAEKRDPGCTAKARITEALTRLGHVDDRVFLSGVHHVQMEPVYGGRVDTAGELRGAAVMGLVRMNHPDVLQHLADLLADPLDQVRSAAARALAYHGSDFGAPLLRLKVLQGDPEERVVAECLAALLRLAPDRSRSFVVGFLDGAGPVRPELAAFALGESGGRPALAALRAWWERTRDPDEARTALTAIATMRLDDALDFLLSVVAEAPGPGARDAISALAMHRHDDALAKRVRSVAESRTDVDLSGAIREAF